MHELVEPEDHVHQGGEHRCCDGPVGSSPLPSHMLFSFMRDFSAGDVDALDWLGHVDVDLHLYQGSRSVLGQKKYGVRRFLRTHLPSSTMFVLFI